MANCDNNENEFDKLSVWLSCLDVLPGRLFDVGAKVVAEVFLRRNLRGSALRDNSSGQEALTKILGEIKFRSETASVADFSRFERQVKLWIRAALQNKLYIISFFLVYALCHAYNLRNMYVQTLDLAKEHAQYHSLDYIDADKTRRLIPALGELPGDSILPAIGAYHYASVMNAHMHLGKFVLGYEALRKLLHISKGTCRDWQTSHGLHYTTAIFYMFLLRKEFQIDAQKLNEIVYDDRVIALWLGKYENLRLRDGHRGGKKCLKAVQSQAIRHFTCSRDKRVQKVDHGTSSDVSAVSPMAHYYADPLVMEFPLMNMVRICVDFPEEKRCRCRNLVNWKSLKRAKRFLRRVSKELDLFEGDCVMTLIFIVRFSLASSGYFYRLYRLTKKSILHFDGQCQASDQRRHDIALSYLQLAVEELTLAEQLVCDSKNILEDAPNVKEFSKFLKQKLTRRVRTVVLQNAVANAVLSTSDKDCSSGFGAADLARNQVPNDQDYTCDFSDGPNHSAESDVQ